MTAEGRATLRTVLLRPGERLQAGALRAVDASIAEEALALFAAITDRDADEISLVFRSMVILPVIANAGSCTDEPAWRQSLLSRYAADRIAGAIPVYTGEAIGGELGFSRVERGG